MSRNGSSDVENFMDNLRDRTSGEEEFHQAVHEVVESIMPVVRDTKAYRDAAILERLVEPDRIVSFRVAWTTDKNETRVNRGYRVQFNGALGPYKGGLRFRPTVTQSVLKFLGFEQVFKNALTGLPLGGGKGGSDFDPKGRSDDEVMRFCQAFMTELVRHIGADRDVPAGDIGVGSREIGYLFGQHRRLTAEFTGVLTGKAPGWGGSLIRPEATGYGLVYFTERALEKLEDGLKGKRVAISGSGNVAMYAAEKATELGCKVVTMSDSSGVIHDPDGIDADKLSFIKDLKLERRGRISEYAERYDVEYREGAKPWSVECDVALPCATQNELDGEDAKELVKNGVMFVAEGANMPTTADAAKVFRDKGIPHCPGKASNAGGVSVSGLEMTQNAQRLSWSAEEVDEKLKGIMRDIHDRCCAHGTEDGKTDYVRGANIAAFVKVADAMVDQGVF
ncbi:MAG: NADP-specific glutamate dehydrogenase [Phycisphaerae bacterium]|nr:NADP-specific glutamate dehydrogenase [Phycisphaerae bacterium]